MHLSKNLGDLSSAGPEILAFGSHCLAKFQPISNCCIPNFNLKYEDSDDMKTDRVDTVNFKLHKIKQRKFLLGHPVYVLSFSK